MWLFPISPFPQIFQGYLSKDALDVVKKLLPESAQGELAAVCSWADLFAVRSHYYWSRALHFVDTPDFRCNYDYTSKLVAESHFL